MAAATRFDRDTAVTSVDAGRLRARCDPGWWIRRGPNGGYVAAILLRAFIVAVHESERPPRTFTIHFTAPPTDGALRIDTTRERSGRSLTTVSGRMVQGERLCAVGLAAFSKSRDAPEFQDHVMPEVPPPERCEPLAHVRANGSPLRERYDQRVVTPELWTAAGETAASGGWIRLREARLADAPLIAAFSDSWPPAVFFRDWQGTELPARGVPTIELTVHFRASLPLPRARPDDFYLTLFRTRSVSEGFMEEEGEIWSPRGELVAQSRQLALFL